MALVIDAPALVDAGSRAQLAVLGAAALRSAVKAGIAAITPRLIALRDERE